MASPCCPTWRPSGWPVLVAAEDGRDLLGAHAVQVQVDLLRALDRGTRRWEWLSGPRHSVERVQGSMERGPGAGRVLMCAAPAPYEQAHQADGTGARDDSYHDQEHVNHVGQGGHDRARRSSPPRRRRPRLRAPLCPGHRCRCRERVRRQGVRSPSSSRWYLAAASRPWRTRRASRWMVRKPVRWTRRRPLRPPGTRGRSAARGHPGPLHRGSGSWAGMGRGCRSAAILEPFHPPISRACCAVPLDA